MMFVDLCLLFSDELQQVVVLCCHLMYVFLVGRCRYRHFVEIVCYALLASVFFRSGCTLKPMLVGSVALVAHRSGPSVLGIGLQVNPRLVGPGFFFPSHQLLLGEHV